MRGPRRNAYRRRKSGEDDVDKVLQLLYKSASVMITLVPEPPQAGQFRADPVGMPVDKSCRAT